MSDYPSDVVAASLAACEEHRRTELIADRVVCHQREARVAAEVRPAMTRLLAAVITGDVRMTATTDEGADVIRQTMQAAQSILDLKG